MRIILNADDFGRSHEMNTAIDYAIKQGLVCSIGLIMGSEHTYEAVEMADRGGYLDHIHCHLNLSACKSVGNHFIPLNENYKRIRFCKYDEFYKFSYYKLDFFRFIGVFFEELETQFLSFRELTNHKADYEHLDFHLYANYSPPVCLAYRSLIRKYGVKTARYFGEHDRFDKTGSNIKRIIRSAEFSLMQREKACMTKSSKIEFFLMHQEQFSNERTIELYVHPEYQEGGLLIDRTNSVIGKDFRPLDEHIRLVEATGKTDFISWEAFHQML